METQLADAELSITINIILSSFQSSDDIKEQENESYRIYP